MEMLQIPLTAIQSTIQYWREQEASYLEADWKEMAEFAKCKAATYESLIEIYSK